MAKRNRIKYSENEYTSWEASNEVYSSEPKEKTFTESEVKKDYVPREVWDEAIRELYAIYAISRSRPVNERLEHFFTKAKNV